MYVYKTDLNYHTFLGRFKKNIGKFDTDKMALAYYQDDGLYFYCKDDEVIAKLRADDIEMIPVDNKQPTDKKFIKGAGNINMIITPEHLVNQKEPVLIKKISRVKNSIVGWLKN